MIPGGNPTDITKASQAVSWVYNWNSSPPLDMPNGILFVPMQWGSMGIATFSGVVTAQGATTILGFNEPDLGSQANLDPNDAASLWKQYIFPLKSAGVRLGAPAISSAPSGAGWLTNFLAACTGCGIDFIPIHWYGIGFEDFSSYIEQLHNQFPNYNFWVTEFADVSDDDAAVASFMVQALNYLDGLVWVEKYAWFGYTRESGAHYDLLDANGNLNALGNTYFGA